MKPLYLFLFLFTLSNTSFAQCDHPDYEALVDFYNSTNGNNWTNNTGWLEGINGENCNICEWFGVGCDSGENIIEVVLSYNNLSGNLNSFDSTIDLYSLDLSHNNLYGQVPCFPLISNTDDVYILNLSNNQFSGNVPDCYFHIQNDYHFVNLSSNNLSGCFGFNCNFYFGIDGYPSNVSISNNSHLPYMGNLISGCDQPHNSDEILLIQGAYCRLQEISDTLGYIDENCNCVECEELSVWCFDTNNNGQGDSNCFYACFMEYQPEWFLNYHYEYPLVNNNCETIELEEYEICDCLGLDSEYLIYFQDLDNDGLGNPNQYIMSCVPIDGFVSNAEDNCDGQYDECGVCNGSGIPDGFCDCEGNTPQTYYQDLDNDGLGNPSVFIESCEEITGYVTNANDECDSGIDECGNCDGAGIPEGFCDCEGNTPQIYYQDLDNDGLGSIEPSIESCIPIEGYVTNNWDNDDNIHASNNAFDDLQINISPNPTSDYLNIELSDNAQATISLFSIEGKQVIKQIANSAKETLNLSSFVNGVYLLKIETKTGFYSEKIIKF